VHSHFAHDPTLIALLLKRLTGMPYSFSAHARDLYQTPPRALAERLQEASAVVTCCRANLEYLRGLAPEADGKLHLIHHGIDLETFRPSDGSRRSACPVVVSVGRLVEKKGFIDLLEACRIVKDQGHRFRLVVYGDGPIRYELVTATLKLGLQNDVVFAGARTQREILGALWRADVFALTPCVTDDGDRDGIPNALVEAMACGLPVVSTAVGGVTEVVIHDQTGLLAEPQDVPAIARHLASLLLDPSRRRRLGRRAREAIVEGFDAAENVRRLAAVLEAET
jgi:glycosyltransferase involved in cell wall biosynthesis